MELNTAVVHTPPRDAATVLLLRDHAKHGLEVFMLRRHSDSAVLGGAYVFAGGKLDEADDGVDERHLDQTPERLHAQLAEPGLTPQRAKGLYVAGLREAFEECGVLLAQSSGGIESLMPQLQARVREGLHLTELVSELDLTLQTRALVPFTRWITPHRPSVMNKRFDARFFLAAVPGDQQALHDNVEAIESEWLSPKRALKDYWNARIELAPPQIMSLVHLARFRDVDHALSEVVQRPPPTIQPEPFDDENGRTICYPGDPRHTQSQPAMPGPSRLRYVKGRFEPLDGFQAFFA
ncbi:MAG: NUDIX hydrolase [Alphaproteobacteria bacterium]|nr:NUDIX hydrolase [Alphaproteobacteria bacterium]